MNECNPTVLLVDDDYKLLRSLERHLTDDGLQVLKAISAAEALAVLDHHHADAVLCDNKMTGTSGIRLLADLAKRHPHVSRFMLTGNISQSQAWLVENEVGVCQLFIKPCNHVQIITAIREEFAKKTSTAT